MSVSLYYIFNIQSVGRTIDAIPCTSTIIALSETNLNPNKLNKINIDRFSLFLVMSF